MSVDWTDCEIELNAGLIRGGWTSDIAAIPAGETAIAPLSEFAGGGGERFNPAEREVQEVFLTCTLPDGAEGSGFYEFD